MRSKILVVLIPVAMIGAGSTAIAKGAGAGGGSMGHGHGHMGHHFQRNQAVLGGWGWGGPYGEGGYTNTTVVVSPRFPAQT